MTKDNNTRNTSVEAALNFLCKRMPTDYDLMQSEWVSLLMDFEDKKGSEYIEGMAGFYLYAIRNIRGDKGSQAIHSTFTHDLNGINDKWCEPKVGGYVEIWREEHAKYNQSYQQ